LGPIGELGKGFIYEVVCEMDEGGCRLGVSILRELCEGTWRGSYFTENPERYAN